MVACNVLGCPAFGSTEAWPLRALAAAICAAARARGLATAEPTDFEAEPGAGLRCAVGGERLVIGNRGWLAEHAVRLSAAQEHSIA